MTLTLSSSDVSTPPRPSARGRRAIVIGAGLGGLATAIGLSRAGFEVVLCERARELTPAGFGIGVTTNGLQALQMLGAYEAVAQRGCAAADARIMTPRGELLTIVPARTIGDRVGVPTRIFHRAALQQALLSQLPPGCLRLSAHCVAVDPLQTGGVRARLEDGTSIEADVLIGADGVNSSVRRMLHGADEPRFAHYVIWLSVMELTHPVLTPGYNAHYWGVGSRFGMHDIGNGQWYWWGTQNKSAVPERLRTLHMARCDENAADMAELAHVFRDFPDEVRHAIRSTPESRVFLVNTRDRKPLQSWSRGAVTLLGDAAHPMLTSLGQGAVMGFEDAAVLVRCLTLAKDVPSALAAYDQLRIPRTTQVVEATRRMSAIEQTGNLRAVRLRNQLVKHLPAALAERQLASISTFEMPDVVGALRTVEASSPPAPTPRRPNVKRPARANTHRIVIVSGASSGIGRAIAVQLAEAGFTVLAGVRSDSDHKALTKLGVPLLLPVTLDVTEPATIAGMLDEVRKLVTTGHRLYGLVNNAAICVTAPLEAVPLDSLRAQLEVNVVGTLALVQACLPSLLRTGGRIVNIGSNVGRLAPPFLGPYAASKAALEALTDVLRRELTQLGVHVSLVVPGPVLTPVWDKIASSASTLMAHASDDTRQRYQSALTKFVAMNHASAARSTLRAGDVAAVVLSTLLSSAPPARRELGLGATAGTWISRALPTGFIDAAFRRVLAPSPFGAAP